MAADLRRDLNIEARLIEGNRGEFTVWVGPTQVASKRGDEFPDGEVVVAAVRDALKKAPA